MLEKIEQRTKTGQNSCFAEDWWVDRFLRKIGLGKGRLDLALSESSFPLGDIVDGQLSYELKKPMEGKQLWVEVRATQRVTAPKEVLDAQFAAAPKQTVKNKSTTLVLYEHRQVLDGHHLYDVGTHTFRIPLPAVVASPYPQSAAPADKWFRRWNRDQLVRYTKVYWQVRAKLEIPWSLGLTDRKTITIIDKQSVKEPQSLLAPPRTAGKNFCAGCGQRRESPDNFCSHCGRKFH